MTGRKSKLNPTIQQDIVNLLTIGATIEDACARVGISPPTFYNWVNAGQSAESGAHFEFFNAVTHAQSSARVKAVAAIRNAIVGAEQNDDTTETVTEIRLRKSKEGEQVPYEYTKTVRRKTVVNYPPDWRAAIEYLKRRDNKNWSDRVQVDLNIDITIIQRTLAALEGAGIDATDFFNKAIQKAEAKRAENNDNG